MEVTAFEQTLAIGIAEFIKFLDSMVEEGASDEDVTAQMYAYAAEMRIAVHAAVEEYSAKLLELHGVED